MRVYIEKKFVEASIIVLALSGIVYAIYGQQYERMLYALSAIISIIGIRTIGFSIIISHNITEYLYILFLLSFALDAIIYCTMLPILYMVSMLFVFLISNKWMGKFCSLKIYDTLYIVQLLSSSLCAIYTLSTSQLYMQNYRGYFGNPNTLGIFYASMSTLFAARIAKQINDSEIISFKTLSLYTASIFLVAISSCRSALVSVLIQILLILLIYLKKFYADKMNRKDFLKLAKIAIGITSIILLWNKIFRDLLQESIFIKFNKQLMKNDVTNGRFIRWKYIWEYSGLFGNGRNVVLTTSHNVYFGLMNSYGKINAILFFLFVLSVFYDAFILAKSSINFDWIFLPIMSFILFFCISMTENYMMTTPMLLLFFCIPMRNMIKSEEKPQ